MAISFGNFNIKELSFGSSKIKEAYFGNQLVYKLNQKPHAKGTALSVDKFSELGSLTGTITFTSPLNPSGKDFSQANDGSVRCVINEQNATVSGNGGVLAPIDCTELFTFIDKSSFFPILAPFRAKRLDLTFLDTSKTTNMSKMFGNAKVSTLDLSSFDTSKVTNMSYMFAFYKVSTLDLSSFDTSKVTDMNGMFNNSSATTLDLSSFDTSNVTNMMQMFRNCTAKKIYCRTEADRQRFLASSDRTPPESAFVVK